MQGHAESKWEITASKEMVRPALQMSTWLRQRRQEHTECIASGSATSEVTYSVENPKDTWPLDGKEV